MADLVSISGAHKRCYVGGEYPTQPKYCFPKDLVDPSPALLRAVLCRDEDAMHFLMR